MKAGDLFSLPTGLHASVNIRDPPAASELEQERQQRQQQLQQSQQQRGVTPRCGTTQVLDDLLSSQPSMAKHAEVLKKLSKTLDEERKDFSKLEQQVWDSLTEHEIMEASFDRQFEAQQTIGGKMADSLSEVGGSWRFVGFFAAFILMWIVANFSLKAAWDPFPFILLNLCLSCLSAFQAPIIMMSQNRQVQRDRAQSDYTSRVNLRAELVTRHVNAKLDALISSSWKRLYESQAIQTSFVQRLMELEKQHVAVMRAMLAKRREGSSSDLHHWDDEGIDSSLTSYRNFGRRLSEDTRFGSGTTLLAGTTLNVYLDDGEGGDDGEDGGGRKKEEISEENSTLLEPYSAPLALLCIAPAATRVFRTLELPWLVDTEDDEHTIYLLRTMLQSSSSLLLSSPWDVDEERMIFEHRSGMMGDNFVGVVSQVRLEPRDPSLVTKGINCSAKKTHHRINKQQPPQGQEGRQGPDTTGGQSEGEEDGKEKRFVSPDFVSHVVETASLVDTGGGAEAWFPFDIVYDLRFTTDGAVLDSILAGDAILTLRNVLDIGCMTAMGEIRSMILHPQGCSCSVLGGGGSQAQEVDGEGGRGGRAQKGTASGARDLVQLSRGMSSLCPQAIAVQQGRMPPRFKPSLSKNREDRISDFWTMGLSRIQVSYSPAPIFACVTLRSGQTVTPMSVEFLSHHHRHRQQQQRHHKEASTLSDSSSYSLSRQNSSTTNTLTRSLSKQKSLTRGSVAELFGGRPPGAASILASAASPLNTPAVNNSGTQQQDGAAGPGGLLQEKEAIPSLPGEQLLAIINPSAASLCNALARGFEVPGKQQPGPGDENRKASTPSASASPPRKDVPLSIETLSPASLHNLPHDHWLLLPLLKKVGGSNNGNGIDAYDIDMPMIAGPAVVFFFSPQGRIRLRGYLRNDGAASVIKE